MKRTIITCVVACLALLAPVVANASKKNYAGSIEPSGEISFKLRSSKGEEDVIKLAWRNLPVTCKGVKQTSDGGLSFDVPVKDNGSWKAKAVLGPAKDPEARAVITGSFSGKRGADGTIELSGSKLPTNDGNSGKCASGKLDWSARS